MSATGHPPHHAVVPMFMLPAPTLEILQSMMHIDGYLLAWNGPHAGTSSTPPCTVQLRPFRRQASKLAEVGADSACTRSALLMRLALCV